MRESSISPIEFIFGDVDKKQLYFEYQNRKKNFETIYLADQDLKRFSVVGQTSTFLVKITKNICLSYISYQNCPKMIKNFKILFSHRKVFKVCGKFFF